MKRQGTIVAAPPATHAYTPLAPRTRAARALARLLTEYAKLRAQSSDPPSSDTWIYSRHGIAKISPLHTLAIQIADLLLEIREASAKGGRSKKPRPKWQQKLTPQILQHLATGKKDRWIGLHLAAKAGRNPDTIRKFAAKLRSQEKLDK